MGQELFDWALLLGRWVHITTAITWIGTSIFFMWLDRSLVVNENSEREGHLGELWMVHGGGFYRVEKMLMGPTEVPKVLHWFKWEAYWTWMSGAFLLAMIFYTGGGTFLLDDSISDITYFQGVLLGIFSIVGSWFFYDFLWERELTRERPVVGHIFTLAWFVVMSYFLCQTLSGRAAYIHIGGMLGTWMTANVFMRIIPRQVKMVEASRRGEAVNQNWGKNAKNRSTHNTYFTLPVIFIMLSNHFPSTYGHDQNWLVLFLLCGAGAAIREFFVVRLQRPGRAKTFAGFGILLILITMMVTREPAIGSVESEAEQMEEKVVEASSQEEDESQTINQADEETREEQEAAGPIVSLNGVVKIVGEVPEGKKLRVPRACEKMHGGPLRSREIIAKDGKLVNVLVRVVKGHENLSFDGPPDEPLEMDQRGCIYEPRVAVARAGQKVKFINSDPIFHNVKSVTERNEKFNIAMPKNSRDRIKVFENPEMLVQTKCSVHPWMGAYIAVLDHPFYSVSDESGKVEISDLPYGNYTIEAWHEKLGAQKMEITVGEGELPELNFTYQVK